MTALVLALVAIVEAAHDAFRRVRAWRRRRSVTFVASTADLTLRDLAAARLPPPAHESAVRIVQIMRAYAQPSEDVSSTDDGGVVLEFAVQETGRELTFVIPDVGAVRYFIARGEGSRRAGIASGDVGVVGLASWLGSRNEPFPTHGVDVG